MAVCRQASMEDEVPKTEAEELYVLLKQNYRISRNIRLMWFFDNIFKEVRIPSKSEQHRIDDDNEIQVLSAISKFEEDSPDQRALESCCILHPQTKVYYLSRGYRLVFALDLSPSLFRTDACSFKATAEVALSQLAECLCSLVQTIHVPGGDVTLRPNIYVTVFVQTRPRENRKQAQDIIVQGCLLNPQSIVTILRALECKIYHNIGRGNTADFRGTSQASKHDHGIVSILRTSLLALQLLPSNTAAGIIVITDGVVGMPDMAVLETLLNQLRSTTTTCSFLCVPCSRDIFSDFSYSVNSELLQFIAAATYGTCFQQDYDINYKAGTMNKYQRALLLWSFQLDHDVENYLSGPSGDEIPDVRKWDPETDLRYTPTQKNMNMFPVLRKKHLERTLRVPMHALLSVRLREGYIISCVDLKDANQIEVKLVFPWNHGLTIKYSASTAWPISWNTTKVEVYVEGTYEFLSDLTIGIGQESWSRYRSMVVRRFKHFIKGLSQTDHMLTHLLSFTADPLYYTINYNQKHVPLFYLPPNSSQLVLSTSSGNDANQSAFAMYWKPILSLDVNIWQKWLHTHRIEIILKHDVPLPKHLHLKYKNVRFHAIQCNTALSQLTSLLREWSTFVLLENHSYVKFVYEESDVKPSTFYLIRLSNKAPVTVIRLAFLIGTTGVFRNRVSEELRDRILSLTFPLGNPQSSLNLRSTSVRSRNPSAQNRGRQFSGSEKSCAVHIHKPLDRMLVRYGQIPRDFMEAPHAGCRHGKGFSLTSSRNRSVSGGDMGSTSQVQDLCRYLNFQRWVWSITNRCATPISLAVAAELARLLVKIRLCEGFSFASSSSSGVVNMVREFPVKPNIGENATEGDVHCDKPNYCLVQFLIFPPTVCTSRESFSLEGSEEEEEDTAEADGELFLATEMWIEPQCGRVVHPEPQAKAFLHGPGSRHSSGISDSGRSSRPSSLSSCPTTIGSGCSEESAQRYVGLDHVEIPRMVSEEDRTLLSAAVTIEHLRLMCVPKTTVLPLIPQQVGDKTAWTRQHGHDRDMHSDVGNGYSTSDEHDAISDKAKPLHEQIAHFPVLFDLVHLLDRCSRIKLMFTTLSQELSVPEGIGTPNDGLFTYFHQCLEKLADRRALLSDADSTSVTEHMIKRGREKYPAEHLEEERIQADDGHWSCYLKVVPDGKLVIILLPATFKDLQLFSGCIPHFTELKTEPDHEFVLREEIAGDPTKRKSNVASSRSSSHGSDVHSPQLLEKLQETENENLSKDDYRLARRLSIKRYHSQISNKSADQNIEESAEPDFDLYNVREASPGSWLQHNLPVFVYECSTGMLLEQILSNPMVNPSLWVLPDIEEDHRPKRIRDHFTTPTLSPSKMQSNKLWKKRQVIKSLDSKMEHEPLQQRGLPSYFRSQSCPFNSVHTPKTAGNDPFCADDVFSSHFSQSRQTDPELALVSEAIVDAYHRCYVKAVSHSLLINNGGSVAAVDIQAATDAVCLESVQEIDITQFLLLTCPQVAVFKEQHSQFRDGMEGRDHDDVFASGVSSRLPPAGVGLIGRRTSSSSTTDPSVTDLKVVHRSTTVQHLDQSQDQRTRGSDDQISNINLIKSLQGFADTAKEGESSEEYGTDKNAEIDLPKAEVLLDKQLSRSAFKKPRRRPRTPPKPEEAETMDLSDTERNGDGSDAKSVLHLHYGKSKLPAVDDAELIPHSLKVTTPLKKIPPASKQGWDDLPEFPIHSLKENHPRHISGSDDQMKVMFRNQLNQHFREIQSYPDFFYYHPEKTTLTPEAVSHEARLVIADEANAADDPSNRVSESDYVEFGVHGDDVTEVDLDKDSKKNQNSQKQHRRHVRKVWEGQRDPQLEGEDFYISDSDGSTSVSLSDALSSDEEAGERDKEDASPLFLCMTCTVRDKSTGNHGTMHVGGLPVSLRSALSCLERPCTHVNLSQLHITLDLIWILLPPETNEKFEKDEKNDDKFSSGLLLEADDSPRHESYNFKERINTVQEERGQEDLLGSLPSTCLQAVNDTKCRIEWLLRDEIICALRTCETITSLTLEKVANHIEETINDNCMKKSVNLQFVFGTEKSFQLFHAEFEKQFKDLKGYRLRKEGFYYYLTMERTFLPIQHWPVEHLIGHDPVLLASDEIFERQLSGSQEKNRVQTSSAFYDTKSEQKIGSCAKMSDHAPLRRTKTAPYVLKSPPAKIRRSSKSCVSLPSSDNLIPPASSCRLLPGSEEIMSVDAIESDVGQTGNLTSRVLQPTTSSQSTPVRKTMSAIDVTHGNLPLLSPQRCSPGIQQFTMSKYARQSNSRLSLPNANEMGLVDARMEEHSEDAGPRSYKSKPVKQRSMENNLNISERAYHSSKRRSVHSLTPLSMRNSPHRSSGIASPLGGTRHASGNSSFGSSGSAPLSMCRRPQLQTLVAKANDGAHSASPSVEHPTSSTPVLQMQSSASLGVVMAGTSTSSGYLYCAANREPTSSPVSVSDCDPRRYSTASWMESGYDGEESDLECEDDYMVSLHDCGNDLPSFWLIVLVKGDAATIYFHRRYSAPVQDEVAVEHERIFQNVIERIHAASKCVNQTLLLVELHDSRTCNALLVEETEEDIWRRDGNHFQMGHPNDDQVDSNKVLLATMTTAPGQFMCDCVLESYLPLHPRLKVPGAVPGKSGVIATVRDLLINLMVSNRKNMFVYKLPDKSVFYCRMTEDSGKSESRRSSVLFQSNSEMLSADTGIEPERRGSKDSLPAIGQYDTRALGGLSLCWYGVGTLIPQQEEELRKMNQSIARKLDESVLEKITVLLQRKSKLTPADVLFIQQPSVTLNSRGLQQHQRAIPSATLSYVVPNEFEDCIPLVRYYLHQNLLQFMAVPRYTDPAQPFGQFSLYRMASTSEDDNAKKNATTVDNSIFLFHQSIEPGKTGYGIGCIALEVTDAKGHQAAHDAVSRCHFTVSEPHTIPKLIKLTEVKPLGHTSSKLDSGRHGGGYEMRTDEPTSTHSDNESSKVVVRFHLWLKGSLTPDHLGKKLETAIQHSLFDTITELIVLRSPLCDLHTSEQGVDDELSALDFENTKRVHRFARKLSLPNPGFLSLYTVQSRPLDDGSLTELNPAKSGKAKPNTGRLTVFRVRSSPTDNIPGKTDAMRSLFGSLNDPSSSRGLLSSILHPKLEVSSKDEEQATKQGKRPASKPARRKSQVIQAEEGERGRLKEVYSSLTALWFDEMEGSHSSAVFKITLQFTTMSCAEASLPDLHKTLSNTLTDCKVKTFAAQFGNAHMSVFDISMSTKKLKQAPGRCASFAFVARNFMLWRRATGVFSQHGHQITTAKFPPHDPSMKPEQSPRPQEHRLSTFHAAYIPRQQFLLVLIKNRAMKVWGYNISSEIARNLHTRLCRCVDFHNARHQALDCLTAQKMGLPRHVTFESRFSASGTDGNELGKQPNPFLRDVKDVDSVLLNSSLPSERDLLGHQKVKPPKRPFFNEAYIANKPCYSLHSSHYRLERGVATQYAMQYMEMKSDLKKKGEEQQQLYRVFSNWREGPAAISSSLITKDVLQVLLQHSRLIHHVSTPVLFDPTLRRIVLALKTQTVQGNDVQLPRKDSKAKKRLSANIRRSGDFSGEHGSSRSRSNSTRADSAKHSKADLMKSPSHSVDESKCDADELGKALMMHYVQYWQSMHFILVKHERNGRVGKVAKKSTSADKEVVKLRSKDGKAKDVKFQKDMTGENETKQPMYLYRIATGGIVIVEISFVRMNFLVKLHILEAFRLQHQHNLNQQMAVLFLNECENLKDYTHVHSFAYDFHLRYVQWYIQDRQTAIKPGYHLVSLLQDFISYHKKRPSYIFNYIHKGFLNAPCSHVTPDDLYEYIIGKQATSLGFKPLKLTDNDVVRNVHALVSHHLVFGQFHTLSCSKEDHYMHDVCYIVSHDWDESREENEKTMKLKFFILFTNRRHLFPRFDSQDSFSPHQTAPRTKIAIPIKQQAKTPSRPDSHMTADNKAGFASFKLKNQSTSRPPAVVMGVSSDTKEEIYDTELDASNLVQDVRQDASTPPASTGAVKRRIFSQGRRQSMPNVGIVTKLAHTTSASRKQVSDAHRVQNLAGHKIQHEVKQCSSRVVEDSSLPAFMLCEVRRLEDFLLNICKTAEIQCYRNHLWNRVYMEKSSQPKASTLTIEDFEHLLKHCQMVPLSKLDERGAALCNIEARGIQWALGLVKRLMSHHDQICRLFVSADGAKQYLGVLNPKLYYMMLLIVVDTSSKELGMFAVMRDRLEELDKELPEVDTGNPNLIPLVGHLNAMVDFLCYHTWMVLLSC